MKKRICLIILFTIIGIIGIEIYYQSTKEIDYFSLDYNIYYQENEENQRLLLENREYFSYYFEHYDPESYITFSNGDKYDLLDAYRNNLIFLGDLMQQVAIDKVPNFSLVVRNNKNKKFDFKININEFDIFYYNVDEVNLILNESQKEEEILSLFEQKIIDFDAISLYLEKKAKIKEEDDFIIYEFDDYKVIKNDKEKIVCFGDKSLDSNKITNTLLEKS